MASIIGVKREIDKTVKPKDLNPAKKARQGNALSSETIIERIRSSLQQYEESYAGLRGKEYTGAPTMHLSFNPDTGRMIPFFPGAVDRLSYQVTLENGSKVTAKLISGSEEGVSENARNIVNVVLEIILSETELKSEKRKLTTAGLLNYLHHKPPGTAIRMDLGYRDVKSPAQKPYRINERVILCDDEGEARVASVKRVLETERQVIFSLGKGKRKTVSFEHLSDLPVNPVLYRKQNSDGDKVKCYPSKIVTKLDQLRSLPDHKILNFWHQRIS